MNSLIDVHYSNINFVSRERLDPLIASLLALFPVDFHRTIYVVCELFLLALGMYFLTRFLGADKRQGTLGALLVAACIVFVMGVEPFYLKFQWFPMMLVSFAYCRRNGGIVWGMLAFIAAMFWVLTSGALALAGVLFAITLSCFFVRSQGERDRAFRHNYFALLCFVVAFLSIALIPVYEMPDYPSGARLSPISPIIAFQPQPLIGPMLSPNPVEYSSLLGELKSHFKRFSAVFIISGLLCLCAMRRERLRKLGLRSLLGALGVSTFVFLLVGLEQIVSPEYRMYSPFQAFRRVLPGMGLVEVPWLVAPFGVIAGLCAVVRVTAPVVLGVLLCVVSVSSGIGYGFVVGKGDFQSLISGEIVAKDWLSQLQSSPSAFVLSSQGDWVSQVGTSKSREFENLVRLSKGVDFEWTARAEPLSELAYLAIDNRADTRWKTGRAQKEGDYFELSFNRPVDTIKVVLSIRATPADFPRGLRVEGSSDGKNYVEYINQPMWMGPVRWTEKGYPYFGPQGHVILDFPNQKTVTQLKFTLIGTHEHYDWSIGEVKLYKKNPSQ